jgi:large subunit ribosomal protein L25
MPILVAEEAEINSNFGESKMSIEAFVVDAQSRSDMGKGASRRLRHAGKVPAVLYGGNKDPQSLTLEHTVMLRHAENEAFFSHILIVNVDGKAEKAILKDVQWHPYKPAIAHMDFLRVDESSVIRVHVPLHFSGEDVAPGAKEGGVITHQMNNIEVSCAAGKLPEYLEVDVSKLNIGDAAHLSDITLPEGVSIVELSHGEGHDLSVVTIVSSRVVAEEESDAETGAEVSEVSEGDEEGESAE